MTDAVSIVASAVDETDLIKVRLLHIFNEGTKWRALFMDGGGSNKALTLFKPDIVLLVHCGCPEDVFSKSVHTFKVENQPVVELHNKKGIYSLHSALKGGEYITHEGRKSIMLANQSKSTEITLDSLNSRINVMFEERKAERVASRKEKDIVITPEDEKREDSDIYNMIAQHIDYAIESYGKLQMAALWKYRQSGSFRSQPNSPEGVAEVVRTIKMRQRDYNISLAMTVDKIFTQVQAAVDSGQPFMDTVKNTPITVERLIITDGLIQKLTKSADHFSKLLDKESKQALLSEILNGTVEQVKALRESQSIVTQSETIVMKVTPIPNTEGSMIQIEAKNEAQVIAIRKLLKPIIGEVTQ